MLICWKSEWLWCSCETVKRGRICQSAIKWALLEFGCFWKIMHVSIWKMDIHSMHNLVPATNLPSTLNFSLNLYTAWHFQLQLKSHDPLENFKYSHLKYWMFWIFILYSFVYSVIWLFETSESIEFVSHKCASLLFSLTHTHTLDLGCEYSEMDPKESIITNKNFWAE